MVQTRIKQRFDSESNWLTSNVILLDGELAIVDCGQQIRFKVGNGLSSFSQLKYVDQNQLSTIWVTAHAISQGSQAYSTPFGLAAGYHLSANADFSQALGVRSQTSVGDSFSFVWNGDSEEYPPIQIGTNNYYTSHGQGTFNINPTNGLSGFYIGEQSLASVLVSNANKVFVKDPSVQEYANGKQSDLSVIKLTNEEYATLLQNNEIAPNALYVISSNYQDAYGQQLKNLAPGTDLSDAVNIEQLSSQKQELLNEISNKANISSLSDYALSSDISNILASKADISSIPLSTSQLINDSDFISSHQSLSNYYEKTETSSASEISNAIDNAISSSSKVFIKDPSVQEYASGKQSDLSVLKVTNEEYAQILQTSADPNVLYVISSNYQDAYGQQLKNLAEPIDLSDAVNKEYVDNNFQPAGNYLTVHQPISAVYINQHIRLSANNILVGNIDCADFIKDGMLSTVELCGTTLVMSFNTDASSDPISVELSNFVDNYDSKIETLSDVIDKKIFVSDNISGISGYSDLSIMRLDAQEYSNLLTSNLVLSNVLYIVQDDYIDAYGQQIKNVAFPTDLSDAANKQYIDNAISNIQIPTDLSDLSNSPGYVTSASISSSLADIQKSVFESISDPAASVRSLQETLISVLNILRGIK